MSTIAREIVLLASEQCSLTKDQLVRDESGFWEKMAQEMWDKTAPLRAEICGMADDDTKNQIALKMAFVAVSALENEAKACKQAIKKIRKSK